MMGRIKLTKLVFDVGFRFNCSFNAPRSFDKTFRILLNNFSHCRGGCSIFHKINPFAVRKMVVSSRRKEAQSNQPLLTKPTMVNECARYAQRNGERSQMICILRCIFRCREKKESADNQQCVKDIFDRR